MFWVSGWVVGCCVLGGVVVFGWVGCSFTFFFGRAVFPSSCWVVLLGLLILGVVLLLPPLLLRGASFLLLLWVALSSV